MSSKIMVDDHCLTLQQYLLAQWWTGEKVGIYWNEKAWGKVEIYIDSMHESQECISPSIVFDSCNCSPEESIRDSRGYSCHDWTLFGWHVSNVNWEERWGKRDSDWIEKLNRHHPRSE